MLQTYLLTAKVRTLSYVCQFAERELDMSFL